MSVPVLERTSHRHTWLDALRGLALLNMIAYHASWDGFVKIKMQKKGSKKCIGQPAP